MASVARKPYYGTRTSPRREVELVAITHDRAGDQLRITATISRPNEMVRVPFEHDETPAGLADALVQVAEWIRGGAP
jgi:hypothetical protein